MNRDCCIITNKYQIYRWRIIGLEDPAVIVPQISEEIDAHNIYFQREPDSFEGSIPFSRVISLIMTTAMVAAIDVTRARHQ